MNKMEIPEHVPATAERFKPVFQRIFSSGGIRRLIIGQEAGFPSKQYLSSGLTRVPFIIMCIRGSVEIGLMKNGEVELHTLGENEAVFMQSNTWIFCDHGHARLYARVTLDTGHTLFGLEEKTKDRPLAPLVTERLELYPCPHLPGPLSQMLVNRILEPGEFPPGSSWMLHAFNLLLDELYELFYKKEPAPLSRSYSTWHAIRNYLQEHCGLPLSRKNVARAFSLTPNHVSRLFARFTEGGFNDTLEKIRMEQASAMLRSTRLTISEIAYTCGYGSANYFTRVFRLTYAATPGEYRMAPGLIK
jgi:AraC-like DNA-binding protein